ncbi:MAG: hypothetical protein Q8Q09_07500 [Deltaproteobacteria bacterium]|nr:hypothetical protein [Deltaproteobacteria bacterium]
MRFRPRTDSLDPFSLESVTAWDTLAHDALAPKLNARGMHHVLAALYEVYACERAASYREDPEQEILAWNPEFSPAPNYCWGRVYRPDNGLVWYWTVPDARADVVDTQLTYDEYYEVDLVFEVTYETDSIEVELGGGFIRIFSDEIILEADDELMDSASYVQAIQGATGWAAAIEDYLSAARDDGCYLVCEPCECAACGYERESQAWRELGDCPQCRGSLWRSLMSPARG